MPGENSHASNQLFKELGTRPVAAMEGLFALYYPHLLAFSNGLMQNKAWAKEVVMDALLSLWENRNQVSGMDKPLSWLYAMVYNKSMNTMRNEKRKITLSIDKATGAGMQADIADALEAKELVMRTGKAIKKLPRQQRKIIELSMEGWSRKEI
jgi:RNA polymerase sigma factor (sigma-70 family)